MSVHKGYEVSNVSATYPFLTRCYTAAACKELAVGMNCWFDHCVPKSKIREEQWKETSSENLPERGQGYADGYSTWSSITTSLLCMCTPTLSLWKTVLKWNALVWIYSSFYYIYIKHPPWARHLTGAEMEWLLLIKKLIIQILWTRSQEAVLYLNWDLWLQNLRPEKCFLNSELQTMPKSIDVFLGMSKLYEDDLILCFHL